MDAIQSELEQLCGLLLTSQAAARRLGLQPVTVAVAMWRGELTAYKLGRQWVTTVAAVAEYRRLRLGKVGRYARKGEADRQSVNIGDVDDGVGGVSGGIAEWMDE